MGEDGQRHGGSKAHLSLDSRKQSLRQKLTYPTGRVGSGRRQTRKEERRGQCEHMNSWGTT